MSMGAKVNDPSQLVRFPWEKVKKGRVITDGDWPNTISETKPTGNG